MKNKAGQCLNDLLLREIEATVARTQALQKPPLPKILHLSLQDIPKQKISTKKDQYLTFSRSIDHFYVFSGTNVIEIQTLLQDICDQLIKQNKNESGDGGVVKVFAENDRVNIGDLVYGLYEEDNAWYRCLVTNCNDERTNFELFYIDFGNTEIASAQNILVGCNDEEMAVFKQFEPQAFKCKLFGVKAPHDNPVANVFSDSQNQIFKKLVGNRAFSVKFLEYDEKEDFYGVVLDEIVSETIELYASVHLNLIKEKSGIFY